jgi:hypothetical protein
MTTLDKIQKLNAIRAYLEAQNLPAFVTVLDEVKHDLLDYMKLQGTQPAAQAKVTDYENIPKPTFNLP